MKKCIRRTFHGGSEENTLDEFAEFAIQENGLAADIAQDMLDGRDPYPYNEDEPEFFEEFEVIDRDELVRQLTAFKRDF